MLGDQVWRAGFEKLFYIAHQLAKEVAWHARRPESMRNSIAQAHALLEQIIFFSAEYPECIQLLYDEDWVITL
jgi:hypothetical protein